MNFEDLHELLREELARRIDQGLLTRTALAHQTEFRQAHISNFLNRRRSLSLEGLDRVLKALRLDIEQLLPCDIAGVALQPSPAEALVGIPVVSATTAMDEPHIREEAVIETIQAAASRLDDTRPRSKTRQVKWDRYVAIRADAQQAAAMDPMIAPGAIVVLDRHYNSLAPYRAHQRTIYAVRNGAALGLRFVEFDDGRLILRPLSILFPVQLLALASHETPADYLAGRVCMVISEL
jgi:hypothetical protein